jgi:hypothetical protein
LRILTGDPQTSKACGLPDMPQGDIIGSRADDDPLPAARRPLEQGATWRAGAVPAGRAHPYRGRGRGQAPGPAGPVTDPLHLRSVCRAAGGTAGRRAAAAREAEDPRPGLGRPRARGGALEGADLRGRHAPAAQPGLRRGLRVRPERVRLVRPLADDGQGQDQGPCVGRLAGVRPRRLPGLPLVGPVRPQPADTPRQLVPARQSRGTPSGDGPAPGDRPLCPVRSPAECVLLTPPRRSGLRGTAAWPGTPTAARRAR